MIPFPNPSLAGNLTGTSPTTNTPTNCDVYWQEKATHPPVNGISFQDCFLKDLRRYIDERVSLGYLGKKDLVPDAVIVYEHLLGRIATDFVEAAVAAHRKAQTAWPATTDFDRLEDAFMDLVNRGILCRHFWIPEIEDIDGNMADSEWGYAYYSLLDTEQVFQRKVVEIYCGINPEFDPTPDPTKLSQTVADAIRQRGLQVTWNGNPDSPMSVAIDWKRRWTGRAQPQPHRLGP